MGLYDNYKLANSQQVRMYQGSNVPELLKVSEQMQKQYDTSQTNLDLIGTYLGRAATNAKDKEKWAEVAKRYSDATARIGAQPNLEDAVRETTMLAKELPEDYAGFAATYKQRQDYIDKVNADTKLNPTEKVEAINAADEQYEGMKFDPGTGRYRGTYTGYNYVPSLNMDVSVDRYLAGAKHGTEKRRRLDS